MLYIIIAFLLIVVIYLTSNQSNIGNHTLVMSSKYEGLVSNILNWNKSSRVITDEGFMIVIRAKVIWIDGESTFTLFEKASGDLKITYQTTGASLTVNKVNIELSYPQAICIKNHDLVWAAIVENIENSYLNETKRTAQDLVDGFYGK